MNILKKELENIKSDIKFATKYSKSIKSFFKRICNILEQKSFVIFATGSLARDELCLFSDIDIIIIIEENNEKLEEELIQKFIYPLWDLKLQIGYSIRTLEEFIKYSNEDITEWTKLIDLKYICGNLNLKKIFETKIKRLLYQNIAEKNFKELFILNDDRREKAGKLVYNLEPDIKNNPGGLRDINFINWFFYIFPKEKKFFKEKELKEIEKANSFFLKIRNISHFLNKRKADTLSFENQNIISEFLYKNKNKAQFLMKKFYFYSDSVNYIYEYIREKFFSKTYEHIFYNKKINENFYIKNFKLFLKDINKISKNPVLIIKAFNYSQQYKVFLSYELRQAIKENIKKIDANFRKDRNVTKIFFNILEKAFGIATTLRLMNQLNFLSYFIPEFKKIKYKITYDSYHKYTIDIHSLLVVHELRNLFNGNYISIYPFISALALHIPNKKFLLLAALIHDIGKGFPGKENHQEKGAKIALKICKRMGLSEKATKLIKFLVLNHTLMTDTALRRDIKNEEEIINFAKKVGNITNLNNLFLLSFADLKGISPNTYDKWKNSLLQNLYIKTFSILTNKKFDIFETVQEKLARFTNYALENLPKKEEFNFTKFLSILSRRLILTGDENLIMEIYEIYKKSKELPYVEIQENIETGNIKITTISYNYEGIFNKIVGILSLNNLNITSAEIYTNLDGTIIDIFEVKPLFDDNFMFQDKIKHIKDDISLYLKDSSKVLKIDNEIEKKIQNYFKKDFTEIIPIIKFNNKDNNFYTILEIITKDYFGLLYHITKILSKRQIEIHSAKINTQGIKAVDTFYITDIFGNKIEDSSVQNKIRRELIENFLN